MTENERHWIALYTHARHEVSVARQLTRLGIDSFVPLRREVHVWSDRRKIVRVPLIPAYVFALVSVQGFSQVYGAQGIVRVVMFHGRPAVVRQCEIDLLRCATESERPVTTSLGVYRECDEVEIISGLFAGYHGSILRIDKFSDVAIRIEELRFSIVVEVPSEHVRLLHHA